MPSAIDVTVPPLGSATTAAVRANFQTAANEISALQASSGTGGLPLSGGTITGVLAIRGNGPVLPSPVLGGTVLQLGGATGGVVRAELAAYGVGAGPNWTTRYARGSAAAPLAVQNGDVISGFNAFGFDGSNYSAGNRGGIRIVATEVWNSGAQGTETDIDITTTGTTSLVQAARFTSNGMVLPGAGGTLPGGGTGGFMGPGTINAAGAFFVNGSAVGSGVGGGTVTSIAFTSPLTGGTITSAGTVGLGNIPVANLAGGAGASATTFWCGNGTWATPSGGPGGGLPLTGGVITGTSPGTIQVQRGPAMLAAPTIAIGALWASGNTGEAVEAIIDGVANVPAYALRRANTSATSPSAIQNADIIGILNWQGHNGTNFGAGATARLVCTALETWDTLNEGSSLTISATPLHTNTTVVQATFGPGLTVGAPTPQAGATTGDINCVRLFVNGAAPGAGTPETYAAISAAGTTLGGATALSADFSEVTGQTAGGTGVVLPAPSGTLKRKVRNSLGVTIQVWSSAAINNLTAGSSFPLLANSTGYFEASTTAWFSIP